VEALCTPLFNALYYWFWGEGDLRLRFSKGEASVGEDGERKRHENNAIRFYRNHCYVLRTGTSSTE